MRSSAADGSAAMPARLYAAVLDRTDQAARVVIIADMVVMIVVVSVQVVLRYVFNSSIDWRYRSAFGTAPTSESSSSWRTCNRRCAPGWRVS